MAQTTFRISLLAGSLALASLGMAQSYIAVDLGLGEASAVSGGVAYGSRNMVTGAATRAHAAGWPGAVFQDMHPSFLDASTPGFSLIDGAAGNTQVGYGLVNGHTAPLVWTNGVASVLTTGFDIWGGNCSATDGNQAVGGVYPIEFDGTTPVPGKSVAMLWDLTNGTAVELSRQGKAFVAVGVGNGYQVGYELRNFVPEARMWAGSSGSMVSLHPSRMDASAALATDGVRQVGYTGSERVVFGERRRGRRRVRFDYACVWTGSAENYFFLDPGLYGMTNANGIKGDTISGYGSITSRTGVSSGYHALAWVGPTYAIQELHTYLPAGFVSSQATGVDAQGNVCGWARTSGSQVHAIIWLRQ